jgi:hypothetical protein
MYSVFINELLEIELDILHCIFIGVMKKLP